MNHSKHLLAGTYLMLTGMFCFSLSGAFLKLIGNEAPISVALFFRFLFNLLFLTPLLIRDHVSIVITDQLGKMVMRGVLGLTALACMFYAIYYMPLVDAILLNNTATLFVPLIVLFMTKQKTSFKVMASLGVGFVGVILFLGPDKELLQPVTLIGLLSGFLAAVSLVLTRNLSQSASPLQILFYYALTGGIITSGFAAFQIELYPARIWLYLCAVGFFGALYQIFLTFALQKAKVRFMSSLTFTGFIFAAFFDWILWDQVPDIFGFAGMSLVILGSFFTIYFGKQADA